MMSGKRNSIILSIIFFLMVAACPPEGISEEVPGGTLILEDRGGKTMLRTQNGFDPGGTIKRYRNFNEYDFVSPRSFNAYYYRFPDSHAAGGPDVFNSYFWLLEMQKKVMQCQNQATQFLFHCTYMPNLTSGILTCCQGLFDQMSRQCEQRGHFEYVDPMYCRNRGGGVDNPPPGGGGEGGGSGCGGTEYLNNQEVKIQTSSGYELDCLCSGEFQGSEVDGYCVTVMANGSCQCDGLSGVIRVDSGGMTYWPEISEP